LPHTTNMKFTESSQDRRCNVNLACQDAGDMTEKLPNISIAAFTLIELLVVIAIIAI